MNLLKEAEDEKYGAQLALVMRETSKKYVPGVVATGGTEYSEVKNVIKQVATSERMDMKEVTKKKYERVIFINLNNSITELLWYISLEVKALKVYIAKRKSLEESLPYANEYFKTIKNFLVNGDKYSIVALSNSNGEVNCMHIFNITSEYPEDVLSYVKRELHENKRIYKLTFGRQKNAENIANNSLMYKNLALSGIVGIQLSAVLYMTLSIGWDIAEPIAYIISQVNLIVAMLIYILTNTTLYESFRGYYFDAAVKRAQKTNNVKVDELSKIYRKRHNLTKIMYMYRRILKTPRKI